MDCTEVSPACPVSDTIYGYYPSLLGNFFFAGVFGLCAVAQAMLGRKYRVTTYTVLVALGCLGELVGYIGRIKLHSNPWSSSAFSIQILLLIVSPSLLAASLYLTLKHLILHFGPQYSRIKPKLYTWVFITCDTIGFFTQLIGGGIEAASKNLNTKNVGNAIMIAGIVFQAVTMGMCAILAIDYTVRMFYHLGGPGGLKIPRAFGFYLSCAITAFTTILIRCIYRYDSLLIQCTYSEHGIC